MSVKQRLRGVVGMMVVWALAFGVVGAILAIPLWLLASTLPLFSFFQMLMEMFVIWAFLGAAMGFVFATAILLGERRHTFGALSARRFAAWGFVGGAIIPMGYSLIAASLGFGSMATLRSNIIFALMSGAAGAALAVVSLRAARRAPPSLEEAGASSNR
jgi:hypothetical protein